RKHFYKLILYYKKAYAHILNKTHKKCHFCIELCLLILTISIHLNKEICYSDIFLFFMICKVKHCPSLLSWKNCLLLYLLLENKPLKKILRMFYATKLEERIKSEDFQRMWALR
ncbi:hypothetical protein Anas_14006, partial [Armadillidium nasatum]